MRVMSNNPKGGDFKYSHAKSANIGLIQSSAEPRAPRDALPVTPSGEIMIYEKYAKQLLPQTPQGKDDKRAWDHIVEQADKLPMEKRPPGTRYNVTVDDFEARWLGDNGCAVALLPREQELTSFLGSLTASGKDCPITRVQVDQAFLDLPKWSRPSMASLSQFDKRHCKLGKRLAETSSLGDGAGSDRVYLSDVLSLKQRLSENDKKELTEIQTLHFPWAIQDRRSQTVTEIYSNLATGVSADLYTVKSVEFTSVRKLNGQATGIQKVTNAALTFHVPEGSMVMLQGSATFDRDDPMTLTDVISPDSSGEASFRSWFRYEGKVYRRSSEYPHNSYPGRLSSTVGFLVTAPPEPGSNIPRVLDCGVLELPPIHREEAVTTSSISVAGL